MQMQVHTGSVTVNTANVKYDSRVERDLKRLNTLVLGLILMFLLLFVPISATSQLSELQAENNRIQAENEYMQAEINSMQSEIVEATNVTKIEKLATNKYGMVYPSEANCIRISKDKPTKNNLASTIKDEAYN